VALKKLQAQGDATAPAVRQAHAGRPARPIGPRTAAFQSVRRRNEARAHHPMNPQTDAP